MTRLDAIEARMRHPYGYGPFVGPWDVTQREDLRWCVARLREAQRLLRAPLRLAPMGGLVDATAWNNVMEEESSHAPARAGAPEAVCD